jgi:hypothetical protein
MTLGSLKLRMLKEFPGLDLDVLEGFISDRHSEIIEELPWTRLNVDTVLVTVAPYDTGTVAVTAGSASVTLTGGTWTTAMTGRGFRPAGRNEFYRFTYVSASTGTLDRPYEGSTATGAAYKIFQNVYAAPSNCRILPDDAFATTQFGPLARLSRAELNASDPNRGTYGVPRNWVSYMDDSSSPPRMQIELYPIPNTAVGIPFEYVAEATVPGSSGAAFLPWMEPATALVEGVTGKILRTPQFKDLASAQLAMTEAARALSTMRASEARRMGATRMQLSSHYTSHRTERWSR